MTPAVLATLAIVGALVIGVTFTLRDRAPHRASRAALQIISVAFLYLALFPPDIAERFPAGMLVVLTPGATAEQIARHGIADTIVALPGVEADDATERVPDLGTALRRHPLTNRLRVVGNGLPPRDIDAARGLAIDFDAAPPPRGIVALSKPAIVRAGATFALSGRVEGTAAARIELRDPAGELAASTVADGAGVFVLAAQAKTPGATTFEIRAIDANGAPLDALPVPVTVGDGDVVRVLVLAGAPDAELKYLRRWASDAGVALTSRIALSDGIAMHEGDAPSTDAATLAASDLVVVDERAWTSLDERARATIADAVRGGLGLLLRITGPLPDGVAADWQTYGFRVVATADAAMPDDRTSTPETSSRASAPTLRPISIEADDAASLVAQGDRTPFAMWRNIGRGRVAVSRLAAAYRLSLGGDASAFGTLWSDIVATLARARGEAAPRISDDAGVGRRSVICNVGHDAAIEDEDEQRVALIIDDASTSRHCASFWPSHAGVHVLTSNGTRVPFVVSAGRSAAFDAAADATATRALGSGALAPTSEASRSIAAPRWPFFVAWLAAVAWLWWLERRARSASRAVSGASA